MVEVLSIALAEIIQSGLAVAVGGEAVLGALAMTGEEELALATLAREGVVLYLAEGVLALAIEHGGEGLLTDVA